jgi:hypothetical protein
MIVTIRRSSGGSRISDDAGVAAAGTVFLIGRGVEARVVPSLVCSALPHSIQNFAAGGFTVPQFGHTIRRVPHSRQNFALIGFSVWQLRQRMEKPVFAALLSLAYE